MRITHRHPDGSPRRVATYRVGALTVASLLVFAPATWAAKDPPAGGAAVADVVYLGLGINVVIFGSVLALVAYRRGRLRFLWRMGTAVERAWGLPRWAALPRAGLTIALVTAVFGMYWDIAIHFENGRDPGPLSNPAHYFMLAGLIGITLSGLLGAAIATEGSPTAVPISGLGWRAPAGALLAIFCGLFALAAFPLDDIWHRLFGQDVTIWSPTHLMMITGAALSVLAAWALYVEGAFVGKPDRAPLPTKVLDVATAGALLVGLSTYQVEHDIGVPQFRLLEQPVLIMFAAGVVLVAARLRLGRGGALGALAFFLLIRAGLTLLVGPVIGHSTYHFPLYLAECALVELAGIAFLRWGEPAARPVTFGAVCGALIGTIGLAAEWGWSHVWAVFPWSASMLPEAAILGFAAGLGGGIIGGFLGGALRPEVRVREPLSYAMLAAGVVLVAAAVAIALPRSAGDGSTRATVALGDVRGGPQRAVSATIRLSPRDAAVGAEWFYVTAWGGGGLVDDHLRKLAEGVYRTTQPIPVYGKWKTALRLHRGSEMLGMPIFMPRDTAIPAPGVPATAHFTRAFAADKRLLLREEKPGVSPLVSICGFLVVLAISAALFLAIVWTFSRLRTKLGRPAQPSRPRGGRAPAPQPARDGGPRAASPMAAAREEAER